MGTGMHYERRSSETARELPQSVLDRSLPVHDGFRVDSDGDEHRLQVERAKPGTYCSNNGIVAFVTPAGELRVSPWTLELNRALTDAGYSSGCFFVPFSNGDVPAHPAARKEWNGIVRAAQDIRRAECIDSWERAYEAQAASKGIQYGLGQSPEFSDKILKYDGIRYIDDDSTTRTGSSAFDGVEHPNNPPRLTSVGHYSTNNGLAAFVNEAGELFVVALTWQNLETIKGAGYQRGGVFVPFSNGEIPVEARDRATLKAMRAQPFD